MTARKIRAGKAEIEATIVDKIGIGLARIKAKLNSFAAGATKIGGALIGTAAAGAAPLVAGVLKFVETGSMFKDMADRTGESVENLSRFAYAAEQSGGKAEDAEGALKGMGDFLFKVEKNGRGARFVLQQLGLSMSDLEGKSPLEKMKVFAAALQKIEDPGRRSALATAALGGSGAALLPLLNQKDGIALFADEADRLGITMSTLDASRAEELGDRFDDLKKILKAATVQVGAALAPELISLATYLVNASTNVVKFVKENRQLILIAAGVLVGVAALGGMLIFVGGAAFGLSAILSIVSGAITAIGAVIGFLVSPLGIVAALLVGGAGYWLFYTESGQSALQGLLAPLRSLWTWVKTVFGGIWDAIQGGDWGLAAKIMWTAIKIAFAEAMAFIKGKWIEWKHALIGELEDVRAAASDMAFNVIPKTGNAKVDNFVAGLSQFNRAVNESNGAINDDRREEESADLREGIDEMNKELKRLIDEAANLKAAKDDAKPDEFKPGPETDLKEIAITNDAKLSGFSADVLRTFNAGGNSFAKRNAEAAEKAAEELELIRREIEDGDGLVLT